jgi:SAM-dependent methyltransferase
LEQTTRDYYEWMKVGSRRSAKVVVPFLMELLAPRAVVDVGCGTGSWLKVFQEHGVDDVLGLDSVAVEPSLLEIEPDRFRTADLREGIQLDRRFDLALCQEVAQYVPVESGERLVADLAGLAPAVLFSSAIPAQGGEGINPQWPSYWAELFERSAYECIDCVRPRIWEARGVDVWYAQNTLLFADRSLIGQRPVLADELERARGRPLSIVHPRLHEYREEFVRQA